MPASALCLLPRPLLEILFGYRCCSALNIRVPERLLPLSAAGFSAAVFRLACLDARRCRHPFVKRVFVSDDEGPAHDETLCGLIDDAEPSRERTVRAAELLRAVRTATHVKWADAADAPAEAPPAKRRRPARAVASAVAAA